MFIDGIICAMIFLCGALCFSKSEFSHQAIFQSQLLHFKSGKKWHRDICLLSSVKWAKILNPSCIWDYRGEDTSMYMTGERYYNKRARESFSSLRYILSVCFPRDLPSTRALLLNMKMPLKLFSTCQDVFVSARVAAAVFSWLWD